MRTPPVWLQDVWRELPQPVCGEALGDQAELRRPGLRPLRQAAPGPAHRAGGGRPAAGGAL